MQPEDTGPIEGEASLATELDFWESSLENAEHQSLVDLINRVLDKGVVITGNVTISVAGVDLVYLGLNAVLTSVSSARRRVREGSLGSLAPPTDGE